MNKGDKIVCIDNIGMETHLTINKLYEIADILYDNQTFQVLNDNNAVYGYYKWRFISLAEFRQKRIDEILNEDIG